MHDQGWPCEILGGGSVDVLAIRTRSRRGRYTDSADQNDACRRRSDPRTGVESRMYVMSSEHEPVSHSGL